MKRILLTVLAVGFVLSLTAGVAVAKKKEAGAAGGEKKTKEKAPTITAVGTVVKEDANFFLVNEAGEKASLKEKVGKKKSAVNTADFVGMKVSATATGDLKKFAKLKVSSLKKLETEKEEEAEEPKKKGKKNKTK
ncbi:hypothetical protein ACFLS1_07945 [Verrucomicrobiota bacterium]